MDGDTFEVARRIGKFNIIRLANVNAPSKNTKAGMKAMQVLRGMIGGKVVTIRPVGTSYNRIVAEVFADRKSVNKRMRERGYR
ncbi:hypothetical protein AKJ47_02060 [candidate division MSBL1 archaeon SCGC-AAA261G05]|nr:hypothetical protein AKJ47_02060 [candidate division MSBL1 archaeon SCGC-AAA261G05]KXB04711.1 hypothetical protein AKJ48_01635 [candidate division MSBL1 archaeon SCGC-AAA261O19]